MSIVGWHVIDIFFIFLGCYFVIRGCFRGFVGEMLNLAGFIGAIYVSFKFSGVLGSIIAGAAGINIYAAQLLAMVLVWISITIAVAVLRRAIRGLLSAVSLNGIDRLLGVFSGLLKTVIFIYVVLIGGLLMAPVVNPTWMTESDTLRYAGRHWTEVRQILVDFKLLPHAAELPSGTLEQILRPYRTGSGGPEGYVPGSGRTHIMRHIGDRV
ncbi:MAG: CvpA family protein [Synergistaceae bacterium]|nr:CvpA family protein [Synergistaceae bacterium]